MDVCKYLVHESNGLSAHNGAPSFTKDDQYPHVEAKVKCFTFSPDGKRIAWISDGEVRVVEAPKWNQIGSLKHPRAQDICFSPAGSYLAVWDTYAKVNGAAPPPNLTIYDVSKRKLLKSFHQQSQTNWKPQWTKDEAIMARLLTSEVHFYKGDNLNETSAKYVAAKLKSFSLTMSVDQYFCTFFVPGVKDQPALVKLFKYPHFSGLPIASRNVFKVDTVETIWNKQCTAVLLVTTQEVEKGASYYGQQMLFFMDIRGESNRVTFPNEGSVRTVAWTNSGREFFCIYGVAPSKASLFNMKCDPIMDFGQGARNVVMPNPVGNVVLLGGMGNIASRFEMWDIQNKKMLGQQECSDITHMEWSPCGQYLLTSTCSPRLRVNNGYKVWHYTGVLQHEKLFEQGELYQATWLPNPSVAKDFQISMDKVTGIESQLKTASKERYVPPSQRAKCSSVGGTVDTTKRFLSQRGDEKPVKEVDPKTAKKKAAALKRKEEARKQKDEAKGITKDWRTERKESNDTSDPSAAEKAATNKANRIKNIEKKLTHIALLEKKVGSGKILNENEKKQIAEEAKLKELLEKLNL